MGIENRVRKEGRGNVAQQSLNGSECLPTPSSILNTNESQCWLSHNVVYGHRGNAAQQSPDRVVVSACGVRMVFLVRAKTGS